ncbi:MAG: HTTM domain-containing protein [Polyangiaceae bacterium]
MTDRDDEDDSDDDVTAGPDPSEGPSGLVAWLRVLFLEGPTFREIVRDAYLTFDRRTLGFTRILWGFLLVMDLIRRAPDWMAMFGTHGVLPPQLNLAKPTAWTGFSIVNAFATAPELVALWLVIFATFVCVLIGYKTRLAQLLALFWITGMNGRVLLVENGGYVVQNLVALWTLFLPMGDRFSVDAWSASMRRRRETTAAALNDRAGMVPEERRRPFVSLVGLVLCVQLSAIYFFNVVHKTGPGWRVEFSAVHYVLYVDRMVTPLAASVRDHLSFGVTWALTKFVLGAEAALPFCLLSPIAKRWARLTGVALILILHVGFGTMFVLGPFAWTLCVASTLFFGAEDWDDAARAMRRSSRACTVLFDPTSAGALYAARALARLDAFELLTFKEAPALPTGIAVKGPRGARTGGAEGLRRVVTALPLGPAIAWILRVPVIGGALALIIRVFETGAPARFVGARHAASLPADPGPSPLAKRLDRGLAIAREAAVLLFFAAAVNQAMVELWTVRDRWYRFVMAQNQSPLLASRGVRMSMQPEVLRLLTQKLRFLQGWFMFSPNPIMDDGTIVVDAVTADGRHVDPFTQREPDLDLPSAHSYGYNQIWSDYFNRIRMAQFSQYRDALRLYLLRYAERTGRAEDAVVSGDVYWVQDMNPPYGDPARKDYAFTVNKLFSFDEHGMTVPPTGDPSAQP